MKPRKIKKQKKEKQINQQGEMVDKQTVNKTNKHLEKKGRKKIPGSGTIEFQS
jgi:hypothetical protein